MFDLNALLKTAIDEKASDVHLSVGCAPRIRVHGSLCTTNFQVMTASDTLEVLLGIVNQDQRECFERDGEIDLSISIPSIGRFRVNAYKQRSSVALAFRLVDMKLPDPEQLMIPEAVLNICNYSKGLVLVTGPSGSGKSTLLAALVHQINQTRDTNIITLEDPIEYLHQHQKSMVNQREIGLDAKSYRKALKAALREDPDVLQISHLEDFEVISATLLAVETGKLVFASMYTQGAVDTLMALMEAFPSEQQKQAGNRIANSLCAIVSRQLCDASDGKGRIPAYEVLIADSTIRSLIREGSFEQIKEVMSTSKTHGMCTMDQYLTELYQEGKISKSTAICQSTDPENLSL